MINKKVLDSINKDVSTLQGGGYNQSHRNWRKKSLLQYYMNPKICKNCGEIIPVLIGQKTKEVIRKSFCNQSCSATFNNLQKQTINLNKEAILIAINNSTTIEQVCCNLGHYYSSSLSKQIQQIVPDIYIKLYQNSPLGLKTKNDLYVECKDWQSARATITKHAQRVYNKSDKPKYCIICNYDKHYHVAHIKPVKDFDGDCLINKINHIDNLIALCPNHHWEFDNQLLQWSVAQ